MEQILQSIENLNLSENTIKNYKSQFKTIHNILSVNDSLDYIDDIDILIHYFEGLNSTSSKRTKASIISKILQTDEKRYSFQIDKIRDYLMILNKDEVVNEFKPELTLKQVKDKINDIENDPKAKLLLMLVTNHPVLRSDYNTIKLKNFDEENDNYYDGKRLVFNTLLKVDNEIRPIKVNKKEKDIIDSFLEQEFLFGFSSEHGFAKYLRRISGKYIGFNYGIQHYRRLYTSTKLKGKIKMDKKASDLARDMNHGSGTQSKHYLHEL